MGTGTYTLAFTGFAAIPTLTLSTAGLTAASLQSALNTVLAIAASPGYVTQASHGSVTVGSNTTGIFLVTFGGTLAGDAAIPLLVSTTVSGTPVVTATVPTTAALPYNATPEQIKGALDALVGTGSSVTVSQNINTNGVNEVQELVLNTSSAHLAGERHHVHLVLRRRTRQHDRRNYLYRSPPHGCTGH